MPRGPQAHTREGETHCHFLETFREQFHILSRNCPLFSVPPPPMLLFGQPAWKAALSENASGTFFAPFSLRSRSCHTLDASHVPGVSHLHVAVVFPSFPAQWLEKTWHLGKENTIFRESPEDFSSLRESPTPRRLPSASKSSPPSHPVVPPRPPQWYSPSAGRAGGAPPGGTTQKACGGGGCRKHRLFSPAAPTRLFPSWLSTSGRRRAPGPPTPRVHLEDSGQPPPLRHQHLVFLLPPIQALADSLVLPRTKALDLVLVLARGLELAWVLGWELG